MTTRMRRHHEPLHEDRPLMLACGRRHAARGWHARLQGCLLRSDGRSRHIPTTGQKIYIFWHEYILLPLYCAGIANLAMLLSRHPTPTFCRGRPTWASTWSAARLARRTAGARMLRKSQHMNLTITPDGPRGPRGSWPRARSIVVEAGMPLVAMGLGYDRPWRMEVGPVRRAAPFSRARAFGPPMTIPPNLDRDGIEHYRQHVERLLNRLTAKPKPGRPWGAASSRKCRPGANCWAMEVQDHAHRAPVPIMTPPVPSGMPCELPNEDADAIDRKIVSSSIPL